MPAKVLQAVIYQADFLLRGGDGRQDDQYAGVKSIQTGNLSESYELKNMGTETGLCRRAYQLLRGYQRATGKLL